MYSNSGERRSYPRIKAGLRVNADNSIEGEAIDLSEEGACLRFKEALNSPRVSLRVSFPGTKIEFAADAKLIWQNEPSAEGPLYGLEFVGIKGSRRTVFRKKLIKLQVENLLRQIDDRQVRKQARHFFLEDMSHYTSEIIKLTKLVSGKHEYSKEIEKKFEHLTTEILLKGYCLEELAEDRKVIKNVKDQFRLLIGTWIYKGPIIKMSFDKHNGYSNDYRALENIYNNKPLAKEGIGLYADRYFLRSPYAVAVRYRKDRMRRIIEEEISCSSSSVIRIFSIACGSLREIRELSLSLFQDKELVFTCLDWNREAIKFSKNAVKKLFPDTRFVFKEQDITKMIRNSAYCDMFEKQDIVYSIGLVDCLPDRVLKAFLRFSYGLLKHKGKLVFAHRNKEKTFSPILPDWLCGWKFVLRDEDEIMNLIYSCGIKDFSVSYISDNFKDTFYFTLVRMKG